MRFQIVKRIVFIAACAVFWAAPGAAEEVGRELNWQTLGTKNFVDTTLPPKEGEGEDGEEVFELPQLAAESDSAVGAGRSNLGESISVFVTSIELTGATVYSEAVLDEAFAPYLNREVTMYELQDLRLALSRKYLDDGYINSGVIIPDQQIESGHIRLQAIEGTLAGIEIQGVPGRAKVREDPPAAPRPE